MKNETKPVIVKLYGGLGNQMFQYAAGRALALRLGAPFILDISWFSANHERIFSLSNMSISGDLYHTPLEDSKLLAGLVSKMATPIIRMHFGVSVYKARRFDFDPHIMDIRGGVYLKGYWQSQKYFNEAADQIRTDFKLAEPFTPDRLQVANNIRERNAISVHVRRGDYVTVAKNSSVHLTPSPQWYLMAMESIAEVTSAPVFFVFSDDPDWARANLPSRWEAHFVEPQDDRRDFEDMQLMSLCKHHIIANSSFSWWGAWLNPSGAKRVIAPIKWFADDQYVTTDLLPENWSRI